MKYRRATKVDDGGAAFPQTNRLNGMSLRDYLMAHAPYIDNCTTAQVAGLQYNGVAVSGHDGERDVHGENFLTWWERLSAPRRMEIFVRARALYADAVLAERNKPR